jgi:hypothetical protein
MRTKFVGKVMGHRNGQSGWSGLFVSCMMLTIGTTACSAVPSQYTKQAERGVTLSAIKARPDMYNGKVVILGGVLVEEKQIGEQVWLRLKNRPVDADYVPHEPTSADDPEAGYYWVLVTRQGLPSSYKSWPRMTIVGRVSAQQPVNLPAGPEPVLHAMYLRGWDDSWGGYGLRPPTWEATQDPNYVVSTPLRVKPGQQ